MCLVSIKPFIVRTILCATVLTYTTYTTIITTITIRSLFLSAYNLSSHTTLRYSAHNVFCKRQPLFVRSAQPSNMQLVLTQGRMTVVCFLWLFYIRMSSVCTTFLKQKVHDLAFQRALSFPHTCCCCFYLKRVRCICQCVFALRLGFLSLSHSLSLFLQLVVWIIVTIFQALKF